MYISDISSMGSYSRIIILLLLNILIINFRSEADGETGKISVGKSNITVYVPSVLRVSGLEENTIVIGADGNNSVKEIPLCVYSNDAFGTIDVSTLVHGSANPFVLTNGESVVSFKMLLKSPDRRERFFNSNASRHTVEGVSSKSDSCNGRNNALLRFELDKSILNNTSGKPYRGALTVMLEPS